MSSDVVTLVFFFCVRRGYADGEIEAMFARYDVDGDRVLDEEEQRRMQADLFEQKVLTMVTSDKNSQLTTTVTSDKNSQLTRLFQV